MVSENHKIIFDIMKILHKIILPAFLLFLFYSCEPEIDGFEADNGNADFSVYVSLGNSLTAGFADGELFRSGQMVSYPNIIAKQMLHTGGGEFRQPLMKDEWGFGNRITIASTTEEDGNINPVPGGASETPDPENFENIFDEEGPFHNMGVPGAKTYDLLSNDFAVSNPYFIRFASTPATSVIEDAIALQPTFFSLWIGNNDVLSYALSGGSDAGITPLAEFRTAYSQLINQLTVHAQKGVVANIPDITSIPFFNTLPSRILFLTDENQISALNEYYDNLGLSHIRFQSGLNGMVIEDAAAPGGIRQIESGELVLITLPQDSLNLAGWGTEVPVPDRYYLTQSQINLIREATEGYNDVIAEIAGDYDLALADMNAYMNDAREGFMFDGLRFTTQFINGGLFSLDAVHLSARGNAIVANFFIDAINQQYSASLPHVSVTQYPGIVFP